MSISRWETYPMIDQQQAISIARDRAQKKNWTFSDPVDVFLRKSWLGKPKYFEIETNARSLGSKSRFRIDAQTGNILSEGYIPR